MKARIDPLGGRIELGERSFRFRLDPGADSALVRIDDRDYRVRPMQWREKVTLSRFAALGDELVTRELVRLCAGNAGELTDDVATVLWELTRWMNDPSGYSSSVPFDSRSVATVTLQLCKATHLRPADFDGRPAWEVEEMWHVLGGQTSAAEELPRKAQESHTTRILIVPDPEPANVANVIDEAGVQHQSHAAQPVASPAPGRFRVMLSDTAQVPAPVSAEAGDVAIPELPRHPERSRGTRVGERREASEETASESSNALPASAPTHSGDVAGVTPPRLTPRVAVAASESEHAQVAVIEPAGIGRTRSEKREQLVSESEDAPLAISQPARDEQMQSEQREQLANETGNALFTISEPARAGRMLSEQRAQLVSESEDAPLAISQPAHGGRMQSEEREQLVNETGNALPTIGEPARTVHVQRELPDSTATREAGRQAASAWAGRRRQLSEPQASTNGRGACPPAGTFEPMPILSHRNNVNREELFDELADRLAEAAADMGIGEV